MKKRMSKLISFILLAFSILSIHCGGAENPIDIVPPDPDPEKNFEALWQTFEDNYAFFAPRDVDWHAQYQTFRPQVNPNTTDDELFDIMTEMLRPLEDFHVTLSGNNRCYSPGIPHPVLEGRRIEAIQVVTGAYLNGNFSSEANAKLIYGHLSEKIGYLNFLAMEGFSGASNPMENFAEEVSILLNSLDKIIQEFKDLDALVIDVRFNGGGTIPGHFIASRFADQKRLAYSKQIRNGGYDDFTPLEEFFSEPAGDLQFTGNIALLTTGSTASAAEWFTLSMMPFPYVTHIGEPTNGIFSDRLHGTLPNGWTFTLSNQRCFSFEMINYEKVGIPPQIEIFMTEADIDANKDNILEAALQVLQGN